jgi:hypothetical protein
MQDKFFEVEFSIKGNFKLSANSSEYAEFIVDQLLKRE